MTLEQYAQLGAAWEKCSPHEQQFVQAMAGLGDEPARRGDIARALGVPSGYLSVDRSRLIHKGVVEVSGYGRLAFTLPGFAAYVRDRTAAAEPPA